MNVAAVQVAERKARHGNVIPPYTTRGRPDSHSDRSGQEQIALMQPYKGYFIEGSALMVHPFSPRMLRWRQAFLVLTLVQSWKSPTSSFSRSP
jgi:hypothetical protein